MKNLLGHDSECQALADALAELVGEGSARGLRRNSLKFRSEDRSFLEFLQGYGFGVEAPTAWCDRGFFISAATSSALGSHPIAGAGLLYLQEPGAMEAVEWLDPQPGDFVLDLCAAPGGKSTQIAEKLGGRGWLVANEPVKARAERLEALLARHGALNVSVYSLDPTTLAEKFSGCFDKVLVDAPCSGESLFAKRFDFRNDVRDVDVKGAARRQFVILSRAADMIKASGSLVYSTCTYSREENEEIVETFLENHPGWELIKDQRRWPHRDRVAGGYTALLRAPDSPLRVQRNFFSERNDGLIKHGPWRWDETLDEYALVMSAFGARRALEEFPAFGELEDKINWEEFERILSYPTHPLDFEPAKEWMRGQSLHLPEKVSLSVSVKVNWQNHALSSGKKVPPGRLNNLVPKVLRS